MTSLKERKKRCLNEVAPSWIAGAKEKGKCIEL